MAFLAFVITLVPTAVGSFFAVMILAGPHGGELPNSLHGATLLLGWVIVLVLPLLAARWAWRRYPPRSP